ncbi:MAG: hypothetical protein GDA54_00750 [Alphaproteobacteria bacterium GM7ARS4]|nr:hypothetical protein [Alphaproteobacteria bacterium GM7ARS4]
MLSAMLWGVLWATPYPSFAESMQETTRANGCVQNDRRGFECFYHVGDDIPQTMKEAEEASMACFRTLTESCNNERGGTSCRWAARFTCRSILDRARSSLMDDGETP